MSLPLEAEEGLVVSPLGDRDGVVSSPVGSSRSLVSSKFMLPHSPAGEGATEAEEEGQGVSAGCL